MILTTATPGRFLADDPLARRRRALSPAFHGAGGGVLEPHAPRRKDAELGASLAGGSVTRAIAALEGEEESLRGQVVRWFFKVSRGSRREDSWATRETLEDGLETVKMLVRDWIVASGHDGVSLLTLDHAERLRRLKPIDGRAGRCAAWKARRRAASRPDERQPRTGRRVRTDGAYQYPLNATSSYCFANGNAR